MSEHPMAPAAVVGPSIPSVPAHKMQISFKKFIFITFQ